jgi:DNA gyrase subunit A
VIRTIRTSSTQAEAKQRLMAIQCPSAMLERALGTGFTDFLAERGAHEHYTLTPVQADAILRMTLGHLVNLEQEKLGEEYRNLLSEIGEYLRILADENLIRDIIREDLRQIRAKHGDKRRTEISGDAAVDIDIEDLIEEETMVVSITQGGYIKRTPVSIYRAQKRGGKGRIGAKVAEEDPIQHLFVTTTHNYLLFFTNFGKVYWHKVYGLPELPPTSKGRAVVNLLNLAQGEQIQDCLAIKDFDEADHYLVLATKNGTIKKMTLSSFRRPWKAGLKASTLRERDELIEAAVVGPGDELIISTAKGNAIRFRHTDVRAMGRSASGVKAVRLRKEDVAVGMVVASPEMTLLTASANGYGKRTPMGPNGVPEAEKAPLDENEEIREPEIISPAEEPDEDDVNGNLRYPTKHRGGLGVKDIKTTDRNGGVIGICRVGDDDEVMMITAKGQIQRIAVSDVRVMGRNTQGVRLMNLDDDDSLVAVKRIPKDENASENDETSEAQA